MVVEYVRGRMLQWRVKVFASISKKALIRLFKIVYAEYALSKLNKDNLLHFALDKQKTKNFILPDKKNKLSDMKTNYLNLKKLK